MLKHLARSVVAGTTALALAGGILAAPQAQAQVGPMKTTQMTVNICLLYTSDAADEQCMV